MQRANDVCIVIKPRLLNRWPNSCARSEVRNRIQFLSAKHRFNRFGVAKIGAANGYVTRKTGNVRMLDLRIVEIIEIIENDDLMPARKQLFGKMRADKTGPTCDENSHGAKLATDNMEWTQIL